MKTEKWTAWAIFHGSALVIFDARPPLYWKRSIAKRAALEHGLPKARIVKVDIRKWVRAPRPAETQEPRP